MSLAANDSPSRSEDPVSNVLKWTLLAVAILTFALFAWATVRTYQTAPPQPERFLSTRGAVLITRADIVAGKAGFQKADLMDYGSLYGMGSYYGEDYTAATLVRLATATQDNIAQARYGKPFTAVSPEGPADGKLRPGDVIEELNHQPVAGADDLSAKIRASAADKPLLLRVRHGENSRYVAIERASR